MLHVNVYKWFGQVMGCSVLKLSCCKKASTVNEIANELLGKNRGFHCAVAGTLSEISIMHRETTECYQVPQTIVLSRDGQSKDEFINYINRELSGRFDLQTTLGIGGVYHNSINFELSCNEAILAWSCASLLRKDIVFWEERPIKSTKHYIECALCTAVNTGQEAKIEGLYQKWLESCFYRERRCISEISVNMLMLLSRCDITDGLDDYIKWFNSRRFLILQNEKTLSLLKQKAHSIGEQRYPLPVRIAVKFLKENYAKPIILTDAANAAGVSENYLSHIFAIATGKTFVTYLTELRLIYAKKLLSNGCNEKIAKVASDCGFNDEKYFIKLFKRYIGVSPGEYRNKNM